MPTLTPGHQLRITTAAEMREIDSIADSEFGLDSAILMENAGRAASQILLERYPDAGRETEILVFAGKGNNAGDAFVVARRLIGLGRRVRVLLLQAEGTYPAATSKNLEILKRMKAKLVALESAQELQGFFSQAPGPFTIVDGILGTGLQGGLEGIFAEVVDLINEQDCQQVVSLDIPTGVSGDTGVVGGNAIQATLTVSFGFPKLGHFLPPGAGKRGELVNVDISLPPRFRNQGDKFLLLQRPMGELLSKRDRYGHKNSFGHTLLIGGSPGRTGAIVMAAGACHRMGTGLVTVGTWEECFELVSAKLPAATMSVPLATQGPEYEGYAKSLEMYSSVVAGPGLGTRPEAKRLLEDLLAHYAGPVVLDADALNLVSEHRMHESLARRKGPVVLTPHMGEMARLLGVAKEEVVADPIGSLKRAVDLTHATVLLKGAATLIASPEDVLYLNHYPNDGMATAGSGDVLAGMIGGLLGQRMEPFPATLLGVYLHSLAGDLAARERGHRGMTAPDIIENISHAFKEINATQESRLPIECRARLL